MNHIPKLLYWPSNITYFNILNEYLLIMLKNLSLTLIVLLLSFFTSFAQVGIGTVNPDASSILELNSTSQGLLISRMSQADRDLIVSPATGLLIYQTDNTPGFYYYTGAVWSPFSGADLDWTISGTDMYNANTGNVGINTTAPSAPLHIETTAGTFSTFTQDFESGLAPLTTSGSANWFTQTTSANGGLQAAESGDVNNSQSSSMSLTVNVGPGGGTVNFFYEVSSENGFDFLEFRVNGTLINSWSGTLGWTSYSHVLPAAGAYTLSWVYVKDGSVSSGSDLARVDDITVTNVGVTNPAIRIVDGAEATGRVLTSDANGNATWQDPSSGAPGASDDDWRFQSGSSSADDIYRTGRVTIGTTFTTSHLLDVDNGLTDGTEIGLGSIEFIRDGVVETFLDQPLSPLVDALYNLGSATNRWNQLYAFNGVINTSDARLKQDITPLNYGLNEIMQLKPVSYKWKNETYGKTVLSSDQKEIKIGFLAQDLQKVISEVVVSHSWKPVSEDQKDTYVKVENDKLGVAYSEIIPVTVKAIQEQQNQIEGLKSEVEILKAELKSLKKLILTK
jgi:hypothetical protein